MKPYTQAQFEAQWSKVAGVSPERMQERGQTAQPCGCSQVCPGWVMLPAIPVSVRSQGQPGALRARR